jgi:Ca-activated chloride channel homolog
VLTDGQDTSSLMYRHDFTDSLPKGEDYDVPKIYTIAYGPEADKDLMAMIANKTNGRLFSSTPEEIMKTYKELSANF